jgi:hypothetical protein
MGSMISRNNKKSSINKRKNKGKMKKGEDSRSMTNNSKSSITSTPRKETASKTTLNNDKEPRILTM